MAPHTALPEEYSSYVIELAQVLDQMDTLSRRARGLLQNLLEPTTSLKTTGDRQSLGTRNPQPFQPRNPSHSSSDSGPRIVASAQPNASRRPPVTSPSPASSQRQNKAKASRTSATSQGDDNLRIASGPSVGDHQPLVTRNPQPQPRTPPPSTSNSGQPMVSAPMARNSCEPLQPTRANASRPPVTSHVRASPPRPVQSPAAPPARVAQPVASRSIASRRQMFEPASPHDQTPEPRADSHARRQQNTRSAAFASTLTLFQNSSQPSTSTPVKKASVPARQRGGAMFQCNVCLEDATSSFDYPCGQCPDVCTDCALRSARVTINENQNPRCPGNHRELLYKALRSVGLDEREIGLWNERRSNGDWVHCSNPSCGRMTRPGGDKIMTCSCGYRTCVEHRRPAASAVQRRTDPNICCEVSMEHRANESWKQANTKPCPRCNTAIEKNGGCNHMTCTQCRHEFFYCCLADYRGQHSSICRGDYEDMLI